MFLLLTQCVSPTERDSAEEPTHPKHRAPAALERDEVADRYVGVVAPLEVVRLSFPTGGRLETVDVRPGDRVSAGDRIAALEQTRARLELERGRALLLAARSRHHAAKRRLEEAERLHRAERTLSRLGHAVRERAAAAVAARDEARAGLQASAYDEAARAREVELLESSLHSTVLVAPFAGRVTARFVDPGGEVGLRTPVVEVARHEEPIVRFAVPPRVGLRLEPGTGVVVAARDGRRAPAQVSHVAATTETGSRLVFVEARFAVAADVEAFPLREAVWIELEAS